VTAGALIQLGQPLGEFSAIVGVEHFQMVSGS
jgi:hypothetical protein